MSSCNMNILFYVIICLVHTFKLSAESDDIEVRSKKSNHISEIDGLIDKLESQQWSAKDSPCLEHTLDILNNVKNFTLWAVWIWDSTQRPVGTLYASQYHLGSYDQCMQTPRTTQAKIRTQYCLADIKLTKKNPLKWDHSTDHYVYMEDFIRTKSKYGRDMSTMTWAVCLPAVCDTQSVSKIVKTMFMNNNLVPFENPNIIIDSCQKAETYQYGNEFYAFMLLVVLLLIMSIISTSYVHLETCKYNCEDNKSLVSSIAKSFDIVRNFKKVFEKEDDGISIIHATKFICACTAVNLHLMQNSALFYGNGLSFDKILEPPIGLIVTHIDIGIHFFIFISGLLLMRTLMGKRKHPGIVIIKRYIRLIGSFAIMIFYFAAVSHHVADGPLWPRMTRKEQNACTKNWWISILMLNNFINSEEICQITYWQIPCDFQLAVLGSVAFYLFKRNIRWKKQFLALLATLSVMVPATILYWNKLPSLLLSDIENILHFRRNAFFLMVYMRSYNRTCTYFVGMGMGYFISVYKPLNHRNAINKFWSIIGYIGFLATVIPVCVYGGQTFNKEYNAIESSLVFSLSSIISAVGMCILVAVFEYGRIPVLSDIIELPLFMAISRLSYGIYLVHIAFIQRKVFSIRFPITFEPLTMIIDGFGIFVISTCVSLLLWIFIEAPLSNLYNLIIESRVKEDKQEVECSGTKPVSKLIQCGIQTKSSIKQKIS